MEDTIFIKDTQGRITQVKQGNEKINISWGSSSVDIDFCNFVIQIVCSTRRIKTTNG